MTPREQFLAVMNFEKPAAFPMMEFMGFWPEAEALWREQGHLGTDEDIFAHFDLVRQQVVPIDFNFVPPFEEKVLEETDTHLVMIDPTGVTKKVEKNSSAMPHYIDFPIKARADFEAICERMDGGDHTSRYPGDWPQQVKEYAGRDYPLGAVIRGPFAFCRDFVPFEHLMMLVYDDRELVADMMRFQVRFTMELWEKLLQDVQLDFVYLGEDMGFKTGPMFSPAVCEELIAPLYKQLADYLKSHGIQNIILDSDGCVLSLLDMYIDSGLTCILPLERAAGMHPAEIRKKFSKLQLIGGIDKLEIARGREGIDSEMQIVANVVGKGGWIPCFDHSVPPIVSYEDYSRYLDRLRETLHT